MMLTPKSFYERHFVGLDFLASVLITSVCMIVVRRVWGEQHLLALLSGSRAALYGATASISGSLLGFIVTAVSIIMAFSDSPQLRYVRQSSHYRTIFKVFVGAIWALGFTTIISLVALLWDRDQGPKVGFTYFAFWAVVLSATRVAECVWVLDRMIRLSIAGSGESAPPSKDTSQWSTDPP